MSLSRFFNQLGLIALCILCLSSAVFYTISLQAIKAEAELANKLLAESYAKNISDSMLQIERTLDLLTKESNLSNLSEQSIKSEEQRLKAWFPEALCIRILNEKTDTLDETCAPHMGFADLAMVRQALNSKPIPMVHAANTIHAHLALARKIERIPAVLLLSFSTQRLELPNHFASIELRQNDLALSHKGENLTDAQAGEVLVSGTSWKILYWKPKTFDAYGIFYLIVFLLAALSWGLCLIFAYRWFFKAFDQDHQSIALLVKDLLHDKLQGNYPVKIKEAQQLITQICQMKRMVANHLSDSKFIARNLIEPNIFLSERSTTHQEFFKVEDQMPSISPEIFRAYDIRGIVGETLNVEVIYAIGKSIGSQALNLDEKTIMIARDGRLSSPELSKALAMGLQSTGCNVIDLGLAPTPLLYYATQVLEGSSGVMLTGSHNPSNYNGLKIVIKNETLSNDGIQHLHKRIVNNAFFKGLGKIEYKDLSSDYLDAIANDIRLTKPLKIVIDAGNGVAATIAPQLMRRLGCDVIELYCEVDGNFPNHHPDPSKPENLKELADLVLAKKADLGVAFDGDADRLGIVDSNGKIIWPDRQMMVFAKDVLSRNQGADIIYDVKCTRHLADQIAQYGGKPLMWKTGHSLIKAKIKETGALLAGEMSGHIFFKERWYGFDDAIYAAARLIEILSKTELSSSEVFSEFPDSINTPELNVSLSEGENFSFMQKLCDIAHFPEAKITDIDGLRVDFTDGFGLVRASNTTPSLVIRFEADDTAALWRIQHQFKDLLFTIKPGMNLPF